MKDVNDYSKTIFSQGIVCRNINNGTYCVIIDGKEGLKMIGALLSWNL